ncbi:MAG: hypothetical protein HQ526_10005, partial [Actinobacteria bacterium]|nr:hypothetical protein [Actinomycetota bacterium]
VKAAQIRVPERIYPEDRIAYSVDAAPAAIRVARGEYEDLQFVVDLAPQEDVLAARYEMADVAIREAGLDWYEVSNWARGGAGSPAICRHNMGYWRSDDWWGIEPGAHSHLAGSRWWNVKHPGTYADRLKENAPPIADFELVSSDDQVVEQIMLRLRLREGIPLSLVAADRQSEVHSLAAEGIVDRADLRGDRLVLTERGRLLADFAVRRLT